MEISGAKQPIVPFVVVAGAVFTVMDRHVDLWLETRGSEPVPGYGELNADKLRSGAAGGTGGSPFAPGSAGNLATEDLVWLLDDDTIPTPFVAGTLTSSLPADSARAIPTTRSAVAS